MRSWLLSGPLEHWEVGIPSGMWGVADGSHQVKSCWEKMETGDIAYFYASNPVKALVGVGMITKTFYQSRPFWPGEKNSNISKYPYRVGLEPLLYVEEGSNNAVISVKDVPLVTAASVAAISKSADTEMRQRILKEWKWTLPFNQIEAKRLLIRRKAWKAIKRLIKPLTKYFNISLGV